VDFLTLYHVNVIDSLAFSTNTCWACGCPTSERFAAKIKRYDLDKALGLGWTEIINEDIIRKYRLYE
jgi:hypothetical protein